jgi:tetratricopeptide (TPR) repeat protein
LFEKEPTAIDGFQKRWNRKKEQRSQIDKYKNLNRKNLTGEREVSFNNNSSKSKEQDNGKAHKKEPFSKSEIDTLKKEIKEFIMSHEERSRQKFLDNYETGIRNLNSSRYKDAIKNFEDALKIDPNNYNAQKFLIEAISAELNQKESKEFKVTIT